MIYKKLSNTDLEISVLGYGGWSLGLKGWSDIDEVEACKTLEKCYENGITLFDTSPVYGNGRSEENIGIVLNSIRNKIIIASKFGLKISQGRAVKDLSRESILSDIEGSLKRLKTDYIDIYQLHWPDGKTAIEETFETLKKLQETKVIKYIGICNLSPQLLETVVNSYSIASVQYQYNLLVKDVESEILPICKKNNISFFAYSPLAQGLLSGIIGEDYKFSEDDIRKLNPLFNDNAKFNQSIKYINNLPKPLIKSAIDFFLQKEEVTSFLISVYKTDHLLTNIRIINEFQSTLNS